MKLKKIIATSMLSIFLVGGLFSCNPSTEEDGNQWGGDGGDPVILPDDVYVSNIEITKQPDRLSYVPNEEKFDPTGMILKATWSDGYIEENVDHSKIYFEPSGILTEKDKEVTIFYGDATTTVQIDTDLNLELSIEQMPNKVEYTIGDTFDPTGLVLGYYNPDTGIKIPIDDYDISKIEYSDDPLTLDDTFITITYEDKTINIPINVRAESIQIELEDHTKVSYFGDARPKSQVLLDKDTNKYYIYNDKETLFDTYKEAFDESYKTMSEASKAMVEYASNNDFVAYLDSENRGFDVKVNVEETGDYKLYIRGASNDLNNNPPTESYDMNISEKLKINIGEETIPISENALLPGKTSPQPDFHLFTNWSTAYLATVHLEEGENIIKFTTIGAGDHIGNVSWSCYGQYDYVLLEKTEKHEGEIESLSVDGSLANTTYYEGETFNPVNLKVTAKYKDGYIEEIHDFTFTKEPLTREDSSFTISYNGVETKLPLNIIKVKNIEVLQGYQANYTTGQEFDSSTLVVKATYEDGTTNEDFKLYTLKVDSPLTVNSKEFTVSYFDLEVKASLVVIEEATIQKIEFEDPLAVSWTGNEIYRKSSQDPNHWMLSYASNNDFLCRTSAGDVLTVKVFSSKARTANLTIRASSSYFKENPPKEVIETKMNEIVDISVNDGQPIDLTNKVLPGKKAESPSGDRELFVYFCDIDLGDIELKKGENLINFAFKNPNNYTNCFQKLDSVTPQDACGQYDSLTITFKD